MARQVLSPSLRLNFSLTFVALTCLLSAPSAHCQQISGPVVARMEMQLKIGDETVDVINKGDLLNVVQDKEDSYLILTHSGTQGLIAKVNAPTLAEAVEVYDDLIKEAPKEGRLYTLRASAWWARGNEIAALEDFNRAIESGYKEAHAYSSRGMFHAAVGNSDKAIEDYAEAIRLDGKDPSYRINRAASWMGKKDFEKAVEDYSEALKLQPRTSTYQQRAVAWKMAGKPDKAIEDFTAALKINPEHIASLMGRGFTCFQQGRNKEAIEDFSMVVSINPKAADAWNNRGYNRQMVGNFKDALQDYAEATKLAPNYALAWVNMAWLLSTCKDEAVRNGEKAVEAARKGCELTDYQDFNALKALAAAFAEQGNFDKAIGWQEKAVERSPEEKKEDEQELLKLYQDEKPFRVADNG